MLLRTYVLFCIFVLKWEFIKPEVLERDLTNSRRNTMFSQRKPPNYES
jgi:hypothetical protein